MIICVSIYKDVSSEIAFFKFVSVTISALLIFITFYYIILLFSRLHFYSVFTKLEHISFLLFISPFHFPFSMTFSVSITKRLGLALSSTGCTTLLCFFWFHTSLRYIMLCLIAAIYSWNLLFIHVIICYS